VRHAAQATDSRACQSASELTKESDLVFITTRDDQIEGACRMLCEAGLIGSQHLVGHMSGAHASDILVSARDRGAAIFSLHPLQAFAQEEKAVAELPQTYFSIEGEKEALPGIETLMAQLGNPTFTISAQHKSLYHLSACILSNYLVTLMDAGLAALQASGIDARQGFLAMRPLIDGTLENIAAMGSAQALTGPIARGDSGTIRAHLKSLDSHGLDEIKSLYTFMGTRTVALAAQKPGQSTTQLDAVSRTLVG